jgi:hypothetical protein
MGYTPYEEIPLEEMIRRIQTEYDIVSNSDQDEANSGSLSSEEIQFNAGWASGMVRAMQLIRGENWNWDEYNPVHVANPH